ncbi:hypothetical protein [Halorubrum sp. Boch-26]|uniref:hypothetical protein n=1 Tax=Halorubrum sp. Boch-26 TaxID=2994426 RepID=UPI0024695B69|nr:hypothetical protein [Halorubrum sp. Boch-26]
MSAETSGKRVSARVSDDDLLDALDDAADEHGSRSEAIRAALRESYANRDGNEANVAAYLPDDPVVRRGYEVLCDEASPFQSRIDVDTAMSRVANRLNIPKGSVKRRVILPLERQRVGGEQIVEPNWGVLMIRQPDDLADLARTVRTDGGARDA